VNSTVATSPAKKTLRLPKRTARAFEKKMAMIVASVPSTLKTLNPTLTIRPSSAVPPSATPKAPSSPARLALST
jgi:hypothetical protein